MMVSGCYIPGVDGIRERHVANLERLIDEYESQADLASAISRGLTKGQKPIDASQISNAKTGHRPFSEKVHRKIEAALGLPVLWFEHDHEASGFIKAGETELSEEALWVAQVFDCIPLAHREAMVISAKAHAETWAPDLVKEAPALRSDSPEKEPRVSRKRGKRVKTD